LASKAAGPWSLTSLREKLIKIGANAASHGREGCWDQMRQTTTAEVRLDEGKATRSGAARQPTHGFGSQRHPSRAKLVAMDA
jgi:hypothetical protein